MRISVSQSFPSNRCAASLILADVLLKRSVSSNLSGLASFINDSTDPILSLCWLGQSYILTVSATEHLVSHSLTVCTVRTEGLVPKLLPRVSAIIKRLISETLVIITLAPESLIAKYLPRITSIVERLVAKSLKILSVATKCLIAKLLAVYLAACSVDIT